MLVFEQSWLCGKVGMIQGDCWKTSPKYLLLECFFASCCLFSYSG